MDPEHLDHYGTVEAMNRAYEDFVKNIPFYGFAVLCIDHPVVQATIPRLSDRRIVTYGMSPQADVRAVNINVGGATTYRRHHHRPQARRDPHRRQYPPADDGAHNVQNSWPPSPSPTSWASMTM
jgi:UDP-N-acetylmuramate--alanine ligase